MITRHHIDALANINRFNGWTTRPYSVLEHTVIGVKFALETGMSEVAAKAFMLHDLEESVFGDVVRPLKSKYMNEGYFAAVGNWERRLEKWVDLPHVLTAHHSDVKYIDDAMLAAELHTVATVTDEDYPYDNIEHEAIANMIQSESFRGLRAIDAFDHLWFGMFPNAEITT